MPAVCCRPVPDSCDYRRERRSRQLVPASLQAVGCVSTPAGTAPPKLQATREAGPTTDPTIAQQSTRLLWRVLEATTITVQLRESCSRPSTHMLPWRWASPEHWLTNTQHTTNDDNEVLSQAAAARHTTSAHVAGGVLRQKDTRHHKHTCRAQFKEAPTCAMILTQFLGAGHERHVPWDGVNASSP